MIVAVLDACVLYPPVVRDVLLCLAEEMLYAPRWTEQIHEEWIRSVLANRPDLKREQLERTRRLMDDLDTESGVKGYERHIESLDLPDSGDRHVLAAAIQSRASTIVTSNLPHFPAPALRTHGVVAVLPTRSSQASSTRILAL